MAETPAQRHINSTKGATSAPLVQMPAAQKKPPCRALCWLGWALAVIMGAIAWL